MGSVWVVTGPIGGGKSTVCSLLEGCGATVMDADAMVHRLIARHAAVHEGLRALFGDAIFDRSGKPDRSRIARRVFEEPPLLGKLEALLHPFVLEELAEKAADWRGRESGLLAVEVVLWFQQQDEPFPVDGTLLVWAPRETLVTRVTGRSGLAPEEVGRRLDSQGDWDRWTGRADRVLNSDCDLAELERRVRALWPVMAGDGG